MTVYYVRPVNGNDASAGTTFNSAKKSLAGALAVATTGGDVIRCCVEGDELVTASISLDVTTLTADEPIIIEAANATNGEPLTDGTLYTIRPSGQPFILVDVVSGASYYQFRFIRLTAGTDAYRSSGAASNYFYRCRIDNNSLYAARFGNANARMILVDCEVDHNNHGLRQTTSSRGSVIMSGGSIHDNTNDGIFIDSTLALVGVKVYNNGGHGVNGNWTGAISNCVFYNNGGDGIRQSGSGSTFVVMINNSCVNNGGYGISQWFTDSTRPMINHNHTHGNTSGATDGLNPLMHQLIAPTGDPLFADPSNGDFTPGAASPLKGMGTGDVDIGLTRVADPAGGGGGGVGFVQAGAGRFGVMET